MAGGGRVADVDNTASLTIIQNDDPISFLVKDTFRLGNEGDLLMMQIVRGGDSGGMATATFNISYQTGSSDDVVVSLADGFVVFQDGVTSVDVNVSLVDDVEPELNENLLLELVSTTG